MRESLSVGFDAFSKIFFLSCFFCNKKVSGCTDGKRQSFWLHCLRVKNVGFVTTRVFVIRPQYFDSRPIWSFRSQLFFRILTKRKLLMPCQSPFDMYCRPQHICGQKFFYLLKAKGFKKYKNTF